ncbi:MAG: chloride channel protein [Planctomycetes bacterium]|nr:chloride channel protein [Planctomycetota bacterium]
MTPPLARIAGRLLPSVSLSGLGRRMVLGSLVGVVAGVGAIVFNLCCEVVSHFLIDGWAGYRPASPPGEHHFLEHTGTPFWIWWLPVTAALGGLLSGLIVRRFAPEAAGHGTDAAIHAYHEKQGRISAKVPLVKIVASALTIGSGGSGGREGPIAQIGAGFGSWLADRFHLSHRERRILLASGMGAGVGSIFHAPLAGALFASEILYSDAEFESDVLIPAAVSTIVGYSVFSIHSGFEPLFATPGFVFTDPTELLVYTVLALTVTLAAGLFVKVFYGVHDFCERLKAPPGVLPMLGGAVTGLIGVGLYHLAGGDLRVLDVLSFGYGTLQDGLMDRDVTILLLLLLALGKMVTTSVSIGSGGSGGVFGPSMVIGGSVGGVVGLLGQRVLPDIVQQPGTYVLVGMAGFFAAAANAPISTLVMVSEMTGNYRMIVPALWVCSIAFLLGRPFKLYRSQVTSRLESGAHRHELLVDLLAGTRVQDLIEQGALETDIVTVRDTMPLDEIVRLFSRTEQHYFPMLDEEGEMVGIVSANDVRHMIEDRDVGAFVIASDIAAFDVVTLTPKTDLDAALQRFVSLDVAELPVVDPDDRRKVLGMLSRRVLIRAYNEAKARFKERVTG